MANSIRIENAKTLFVSKSNFSEFFRENELALDFQFKNFTDFFIYFEFRGIILRIL